MAGDKKLTDLPWPIDEGSTHWEGCYRERRHHNCAVTEVERLRADNARLRKALRAIVICSGCEGDCEVCPMGRLKLRNAEPDAVTFIRKALEADDE